MADLKISALPAASDLTGAIIPIVQGGANKHADATLFATSADIAAAVSYCNASFLTAETDPVFTAWDKSTGISITESQISDLKSYELADPTILKSAVIDDASTAANRLWSAAQIIAALSAPSTTPNIVDVLNVEADTSYIVIEHLTVTDQLTVAGYVGVI
jgi:hypothetical protein